MYALSDMSSFSDDRQSCDLRVIGLLCYDVLKAINEVSVNHNSQGYNIILCIYIILLHMASRAGLWGLPHRPASKVHHGVRGAVYGIQHWPRGITKQTNDNSAPSLRAPEHSCYGVRICFS